MLAVFVGDEVGPFLPQYKILGSEKIYPLRRCLKRFLGNFNVLTSQNSFNRFLTPRMYGTTAKPAVDSSSTEVTG